MGKTVKQRVEQLIPYQFKPGQSGNPKGRPKGKTMKEFAREFLLSMSNEDKIAFMNSLQPDMIWRMAEGNPHQSSDTEVTFPETLIDLIKDAASNKTGDNKLPTKDS